MSRDSSDPVEKLPEWQNCQKLKSYVIDGKNFSTIDGFYNENGRKLLGDRRWGRNLGAFDDVLLGGFGTPPEGFIIIWRASSKSKADLGYAETARYLELMYRDCHPTGRKIVGGD